MYPLKSPAYESGLAKPHSLIIRRFNSKEFSYVLSTYLGATKILETFRIFGQLLLNLPIPGILGV